MGKEISKPLITADTLSQKEILDANIFSKSDERIALLEAEYTSHKERHDSLFSANLLSNAAIGIAESGSVRYMNGLSTKMPKGSLPKVGTVPSNVMIAALVFGVISRFIPIEYERYMIRIRLREISTLLKQETKNAAATINEIVNISPHVDYYPQRDRNSDTKVS